jgi:SpoVK/Ycf46/Vps4 family AAA+-type ATPase
LQREKGAILELTPAAILKGIAMSKSHAKAETGSGPKEWTSKALKNVTPDNEFERKLLSEGVVVPAEEVGVKFDDIGALDSVKEVLQEVVMLPLRRPGLFRKGNLAVPTKGVLLFGLPGTGKTLSAKAVATEAGANFINITMSSITSKWFGEGEKYVRAVFTLARKLSPAVIYVDEVDSMLGRRERPGEHEAMRKIKNEFMLQWDGLRSTDADRVLVLGSTNRPFDLDDAVLRRFPRRLMVDLPDSGSRARILKKITEKEELAADVDLEALAETLDGYSGSDLRNLCVSAAMEPVREILAAERAANGGEIGGAGGLKKSGCGGDGNGDSLEVEEAEEEEVRALEMRDFQKAATSMSASVSEDAPSVAELRKWNATYGENGSRRKEPLAYFM